MATNNECRGQIELLSDDNYRTWAVQMEALLVKKGLWDYVNNTETLESITDETKKEEWFKNDKEARCELILTITPSELKYIRNCETSYEMWDELESINEIKDKAKKRSLFNQLVLHHSTNDSDMKNHTLEFFNIVNKLNKMCADIDEELLVIMFLHSLPDSYTNFRYAIELQKKLPTLEVLKIKIMDVINERSRQSKSEKPPKNNSYDIEQPL